MEGLLAGVRDAVGETVVVGVSEPAKGVGVMVPPGGSDTLAVGDTVVLPLALSMEEGVPEGDWEAEGESSS